MKCSWMNWNSLSRGNEIHVSVRTIFSTAFVISLLFSSFAQEYQWGNYIIQHYSPDDYNAGTQNWAVKQRNDGVLFVGNREGLLEFDGETWKKINVSNRSVVRSLDLDENNRLYIGASNEFGYLTTDSLGSSVYKSLKSLLPDSLQQFKDVWSTHVIKDKVYFQTRSGFFIYDNGSIEVISLSDGVIQRSYKAQDDIYLFVFDPDGDKDGIYYLDKENNSLVYTDYREDDRLRGVLELDDGNLMFMTQKIRFLHFDTKTKSFTDQSESLGQFDLILEKELPYTIIKLSNGDWCIGTLKNGIYFFNYETKSWRHIDSGNGLLGLTVYDLLEDQFGNVWSAGEEGINYIRSNEPLRNYTDMHGLEGTSLSSMLFRENLYLGTSIGAFKVARNGRVEKILPIQDQLWQLFESNGKLYGVLTSGISTVDGDKHQMVFNSEPWMVASFPSKRGQFVMGNYDDGITILKGSNRDVQPVRKVKGFDKNSRKVAVDHTNAVWVSDRGFGVWRLELTEEQDSIKSIEFFGEGNGLTSDKQNYVFPYKWNGKDIGLIGANDGFYYYNYSTGQLEALDELNELFLSPGNIRNGFDFDESGNMCFAKDDKFMIIENSWTQPKIDSVSLMLIEGQSLDEINSIGNGQFAISTEKGTYIYDVDRSILKKPTVEFQAAVRAVNNNGELFFGGTSDGEDFPTFDFSNNNFLFRYAVNFSAEPEKTNYFIMLEGFDKDWSSPTKENYKEYTNLSEGDYSFKVKAINYFGQESTVGSYSFQVLPPWYRTTLAYSGYTIFGMLVLLGSVRIYGRKLQKDKEKLEVIVKERTAEVENQKTEISAQASQLKEANEELLKLGNYRESMTGMIAHDMKTPLSVIMNSNDELATKQMASQMLHLINNMLDVHRFESTEVKLKKEQVSFDELVKVAEQQVKFLLDEKDLQLEKAFNDDYLVSIDQSIMLRVFVNLLTNAIKFSPFNSSIVLNAKIVEDNLEVSVNNKGQVIPKDKIETIFESFGQLDARDSGGVGSTGLGLTFVKLALDAHDSDIHVTSSQSEGTTFGFKLNLVGKSTDQRQEKRDASFDALVINKILKPDFDQLQGLQIHQIGDLERVLSELRGKDQQVDEWIEHVLQAAYAGNIEKYEKLMKLVAATS